jgi:hypothetical protein
VVTGVPYGHPQHTGVKMPRYKITNKKTGSSTRVVSGKYTAAKKKTTKPKRTKVPKNGAKYTGAVPKKVVKTKGGNYPVYGKKSSSAKGFRSAFRAARASGKKIFTWRGRKYTTKLK